MTEDQKDTDDLESQLSLISVSMRWWHVCVILLCVQTLGWIAFTWWGVEDSARSYRETIEAMVYGSSRAIPLFIVLSMTIPILGETIGGLIVVLAEYLKHRFEKRGEARNQAAWEAWYKRMKDAEAKGEPFDEPPPSLRSSHED